MVSRDAIMNLLRTIPDPEMPISIVDLGLVETVEILAGPNRDGAQVSIEILPTFVGCPALPMIEQEITQKIGDLDGVERVEVRFIHDPAWSVDRISDAGRESLREFGVTVPESGNALRQPATAGTVELRTSAIPCPFCGSTETHLDSPFGPTRCRMIYYCDACRNAFEHMKKI